MDETESLLDPRTANLRTLMATVDAAYQQGDFSTAEPLDAMLEALLDDLDHSLCGLDEGGDVLDQEDGAGIEDQLLAAWSDFVFGSKSF